MTAPPKPQGRPNKYEDVVTAARTLADRIRDQRDVDTFGFDRELALLRNELKKVDR